MKSPFSRILLPELFLFAIFYICLPLTVASLNKDPLIYKALPAFYLTIFALTLYLIQRNASRKRYLEFEGSALQEKLNILADQIARETKHSVALHEKINRYLRLREIIENINQELSLDSVANSLSAITFLLVANQKGTCILYIADQSTAKLSILKTRKEDKKLIIKAKEGDILDHWIMRHASPLFIEDVRRDFRFDLEKLKLQDIRPVSSYIGAPLISDHRFLGLLRLDYPLPGFYTQDDLRLLVTICDLGAVAFENAELFRKTEDLAIHDGLTGLYTKGYFLERIKEECQRSARHKKSLVLFLLDIDHFKNYNDEFGHTIGDLVLKNLAAGLIETLRGLGPVIGRFGGEEFCVILPRVDKKRASLIAEEVRANVEKSKLNLRGIETGITVSIGVASFPDDSSDEMDLILKADRAMYEAKQRGRNRVVTV